MLVMIIRGRNGFEIRGYHFFSIIVFIYYVVKVSVWVRVVLLEIFDKADTPVCLHFQP